MKKGFQFPLTYSFLALAAAFALAAFPLAAQVNRDELQELGPVEFINYVGPYTRIETRAQIRDIGYSLGLVARTGQPVAGTSGRYFIIHSVSEDDGDKIDADIMGLGADVGVDHIRNLRTIVQGYLEAAYEYNGQDASLLAEYITIYNAVFRGDMNYFSARYKDGVMDNLSGDRAGLSIRYDEWPGRTLMLIPLGFGGPGDLNAIDTSYLTDPLVTEQLREEPDAGIDTRRDMVDLQERQAEQANQQAATQRETVQEAQSALNQDRQELQEAQDQGAVTPQEAADRQTEFEQRQEQINQQNQQAAQAQTTADRLTLAAQQGRQDIAQDQQAFINVSQTAGGSSAGLLGAMILTTDASLGRVVLINPANGTVLRRSPLTTVNARTLVQAGGKLIAIAGENRGNAAIRLVEINRDSLEMTAQGDDDIAPTSLLWAQGNDLYAISSSGGNLYIARFDTGLARQARSSVTVHPFASVSFIDGNLLTQRADGTALVLNPSDLTERR